MQHGGQKVIKPQKTKFKQGDFEMDNTKSIKKNKKRDKLMYKLQREEKEYVI